MHIIFGEYTLFPVVDAQIFLFMSPSYANMGSFKTEMVRISSIYIIDITRHLHCYHLIDPQ